MRLLASQVEAGTYEVDAHKLADVLVQRALFHRRVVGDLLAPRSLLE